MSLHLSSHSPSPSLPPCLFSCRIVSIEHYITPPAKDLDVCYSAFRSSAVDKVPVIRIFGSTPAGQKTCLHVHGVFPFLYVPCNHPDPNDEYLQLVARSIDHALQLALGASSRAVHHVYKIILVKGKPFYGYHDQVQLFLKIYLYNPALIKRLSELLVAGAVMNEVLQPHESHVPFVLQFMIDHNLFGMNHIHLSEVKFRIVGSGGEGSVRSPSPSRRRRSMSVPFSPSPTSSHSSSFLYNPSQNLWDVDTLARDKIVCLPRVSVCELEADAVAGDILNRHELSLVSEGFPGLAALWEEERQRRKALDVDTPLTPPPSPGRSSQVNEECESGLQEELEAVLQERFSQMRSGSSSLLGSPPPCLHSTSSQRLPSAPNSIGSREGLAEVGVAGGGVADMASLVDEEAVQKTVRLSQRCSMEAIEKSSNKELIELLNELCQSNDDSASQFLTEKSSLVNSSQFMQPQSSQSDLPHPSQSDLPHPSQSRSSQLSGIYSSQMLVQPSQSLGEVLLSKIRRSESVLSGSLFSTPSPSPPPMHPGHRKGGGGVMGGVSTDRRQPYKGSSLKSSQPIPAGNAGVLADSSSLRDSQVTSGNIFRVSNKEKEDHSRRGTTANYEQGQAKLSSDNSSEGKVRRRNPDDSLDAATQPHMVVTDKEMEDSFDGGLEVEGMDEVLFAGSEYDISCAQESHTPVSDVGLWEVQQKDAESVEDFSSDLKDKGAGTDAVKTVYEMEDIFSSEYPESGGSSIVDFMEPMSPWNVFPEESSPVRESPQLSSQPAGSGFPVMTKKTKRNLMRLVTCSQEEKEKEDEGEEGEEEGADMEEALMLQAIWDDVDEYKGNVPDEFNIPQLDGPINDRTSRNRTAPSSSVPKKTGPARLGMRRKMAKMPAGQQKGMGLRSKALLGGQKTRESVDPEKPQTRMKPNIVPSTVTSVKSVRGQLKQSLEETGDKKKLMTSDSSSLSLRECGTGMVESPVLPISRKRGRPSLSSVKKKQEVEESSSVGMEDVDAVQAEHESSLKKTLLLRKRKRKCTKVSPSLEVKESREKEKMAFGSSLTLEEVVAQLDSSFEETPKRKRGRPRLSLEEKEKKQEGAVKDSCLPAKKLTTGQTELKRPTSMELPVKKKRGRPRLSLQEKEKRKQRTVNKHKETTPESHSILTRKTPESHSILKATLPETCPVLKETIPDAHSTLKEAVPGPGSIPKETVLESRSMLKDRAHACRFNLKLAKLLVDSSSPSFTGKEGVDIAAGSNDPLLSLAKKEEKKGKAGLKLRKKQQPSRSPADGGKDRLSGTSQLRRSSLRSGTSTATAASSESGNNHQSGQEKTLPLPQSSTAFGVASPSDSDSMTPVKSGRSGLLPLVSPNKCDNATSDSDNGQANHEDTRTDFSLRITSDSDVEMEAEEGVEKPLDVGPQEVGPQEVGPQEVGPQEVGTKKALFQEPKHRKSRSVISKSPSLFATPPTGVQVAPTTQSRIQDTPMEVASTPVSSSMQGTSTISPPATSPVAPLPVAPPTTTASKEPTTVPDHRTASPATTEDKETTTPTVEDGMPREAHASGGGRMVWCPLVPPLSWRDLCDTSFLYRIPSVVHRKPFYGNPKDVQPAKRVGGQVLRVPSNLPKELKEFDAPYVDKSIESFSRFGLECLLSSLFPRDRDNSMPARRANVILTPALPPPCPKKLEATFQQQGPVEDDKKGPDGREGTSVVSVPADPGPSEMEVVATSSADAGLKEAEKNIQEKLKDGDKNQADAERRDQLPTQSHQVQKKSLSLDRTTSASKSMSEKDTSQLEGPTPDNSCGFKINQSVLCNSNDIHEVQHLTCMSIEVHAHTRGRLKPDPELDPILAIFYFIHHDWPNPHGSDKNSRLGLVAIDIHNSKFTSFVGKPAPPDSSHKAPPTHGSPQRNGNFYDKDLEGYLCRCGLPPDIQITYVSSEHQLLEFLVRLIRDADPDFLIGYEVVMSSWGYLTDRAAAINVNLINLISRMPQDPKPHPQNDLQTSSTSVSPSKWRRKPFDLRVPGRIVLNVWQFMRHEVNLTSYTFESLCFHTLHRRLPHYSHQTLTSWYNSKANVFRYRVLEYYLERTQCNYILLEKFNLIGRTSEFARLYGIEFENIANRGSQYKVESMMLRLTKPANYIAVSPSTRQRARMAAPECIPLVMEPESRFYEDPIILLDFQSLYPSMVLAYNYCYSTCLGRFWSLSQHGEFKFGTTSLNIPDSTIKNIRGNIHISPNGVAFVKKRIRKGILPQMLEEILNTRIMVKSSMKAHKSNKLLQRLLNSRQLALKLVANTTFGYTAASYSGRMPCIEIADSIVQKGRETLERAIHLVNSTPEWGGRVVYGDTDSLFVLVKGASKDEAFRIGKEICERVAAQNPKPVKLKLEKVYLPCILQSKKRYVGLSYESPEQATPTFDAKGIETVRRDNCPAVGKVLQKSLEILFKSRDVSLVKIYIQRQFRKLLEGNVNIQDFIIAKEYRGRDYYSAGASVPALHLARQSMALDRRSEPRQGERVPYVVVYGSPGLPLIQLVRRPQELLSSSNSLRLNASYYITKQLIPPLERAFSLLGVDVREWYFEGPKLIRAPIQASKPLASGGPRNAQGTISHYFASKHCPLCSQLTLEGVCGSCQKDPQRVIVTLATREREDLQTHSDITEICANCVGCRYPSIYMQCDSLDCPVLHRRFRAQQDLDISQAWKRLLNHL